MADEKEPMDMLDGDGLATGKGPAMADEKEPMDMLDGDGLATGKGPMATGPDAGAGPGGPEDLGDDSHAAEELDPG